MKTIIPGHTFELDHLDGSGVELLQFVKRDRGNNNVEGTTNQEVLRVLIERIKFLDMERPWIGNDEILQHLRMAIVLHECRHLQQLVERGEKVEFIEVGEDGHFKLTGNRK